jgi:hypothetical protein
MARYVLIVLSNPTVGREEDYKRCYLEQHIPDCLRVPGFVSGKLMPAAPQQPALQKEKRWNYLTLFEVETDDLASVLADLNRRLNTPEMPISDAFNFEGFHFEVFAEPDEKVIGPGTPKSWSA